jgi:hypothetical protein
MLIKMRASIGQNSIPATRNRLYLERVENLVDDIRNKMKREGKGDDFICTN